ncbi:MAG: PQQ-binding-like beta-propeller repeat protein [Verrucomicrobiae bacterium]|nr:PQQ-binding-like beta-propeller repeat protein [Verrucomicrobiae bacterium]
MRIVALLAALAVAPVGIWWGFHTENFARYWMALVLPFIGVASLLIWFLIFGGGQFATRAKVFGWIALVGIISLIVFRATFRYDGSTSGASLPRFVPRWTPEDAGAVAELPEEEIDSAPRPVAAEALEGVVDSPQLYGPNRDAVWPETEVIASLAWEENPPEQLWRRPIGLGWSGFSVVGRRAVTMEQRGDEELVTCYDLLTGEILWTHRDEARFYNVADSGKEMAGDGPRAVPTIHGQRVFTYGATGVLNCLSLETGEAIWQRDVFDELGKTLPKWGKSTSPLMVEPEGLVVISGPERSGPTLLAYRAETGELAWQYEGHGASYSSPRLIELKGLDTKMTRQLVSVNAGDVTGHDPATGEELWLFPWYGEYPKVAQPVKVGDDRVLVTASYGAGSYLLRVTESQEEGATEPSWSVFNVWKTIKLKTKFSTAVTLDGYAYGLDEGRLACVNLSDGSRVWKDGKYGFGQNLLVGDRLLIQAEEGYLAVVVATPEGFSEIARHEALHDMTWNPPTLAGRYLLVRNDREAVCFKLAEKKK